MTQLKEGDMWDFFEMATRSGSIKAPVWRILPDWGVAPTTNPDGTLDYRRWRVNHIPSGRAISVSFGSRKKAVAAFMKLQQVTEFWQLNKAVAGVSDLFSLPQENFDRINDLMKSVRTALEEIYDAA